MEAIELENAIELYGRPILRYCHSILCNYHDAQDAVQTTFIKAYGADYTGNTPLGPWLYRIAYHTCLDMMRKRRRFLRLLKSTAETDERDDRYQSDSYPLEEPYMGDDIKTALLTLSISDRALVFNRVIDEMEYNELASIYNASPAALRKRYERAKKKLAKQLEGGTQNG